MSGSAGTPARRSKIWRAAIPILAGLLIALAPAPQGLDAHAWRYFAAFVAVILSLITEPLPAPALGLIAVTFIAMVGLPFSPAQRADPGFRLPAEALKWALSGFANGTVWLIFSAFVVSMGYERTRLGRRIALFLVRHLGRRTLGLGYAITFADLLLAPFTPSNTARSAGTIFPILRNVPELYGSQPGESPRAIGAYLMWLAFATTCVTSSMFLTALAPNLLAVEMVKAATGVQITWTAWLVGFLPVGVLLVVLLPYVTYKIYPPTIRESVEVTEWAASELNRMGRMSAHETIMASLVLGALALWIFGAALIDPTMVALAAIAMMLLTGVVDWDDIVGHKAAWNVLVWFATLVILADGLGRVGFIGWFGRTAAAMLAGQSPTTVMVSLVVVFFLVHYTFASLTAHTTAVLPAMLAAGMAVPGMPIQPFALLLAYSLGIMGVITPYATGPAPVYFASGFIPRGDFWRLGLIFGAIYLGALLLIGVPWLMAAAS